MNKMLPDEQTKLQEMILLVLRIFLLANTTYTSVGSVEGISSNLPQFLITDILFIKKN